jgi:hypothetical protein
MNKVLIGIAVLGLTACYVQAEQDATLTQRQVRDPRQLEVILEANATDAETRLTATEAVSGTATIVGADAATNGTGTITIQLKDAAGVNLAEQSLIRTWIGTADDFGVDALTDYSVGTGVEKEEVTANGEYLAISDTNGVVVMDIDLAGGAAGSVYAWAAIGGRIVASGEVVLTAP